MPAREGSNRAIPTYAEFWPFYLREHSRPTTRTIHFIGTGTAVCCVFAGLVTGAFWTVPLALVAGYGPAWFAHYFVEKNRPATFTHPRWSLASDFRMGFLSAALVLSSNGPACAVEAANPELTLMVHFGDQS
jgi:hypothetical protein